MRNLPKISLVVYFCSLFLTSAIFSQQTETIVDTVTVDEGQRVQMFGSADGTSPMTFQWYKKGATDTLVFTGQTYVIERVKLSDAGNYYVIVTNSLGSTQSGISALNVIPSPVAGIAPAFIYIEARDDIRAK